MLRFVLALVRRRTSELGRGLEWFFSQLFATIKIGEFSMELKATALLNVAVIVVIIGFMINAASV